MDLAPQSGGPRNLVDMMMSAYDVDAVVIGSGFGGRMMPLKHILREPQGHFLLFDVGIFLTYSLVQQRTSIEPEKIVITEGQIEHLAAGFARTWQRPPSADELGGT